MICVIQVAQKYVRRGSEIGDVRYTHTRMDARTFASIASAQRTIEVFGLTGAVILYKWEL